jgi:seryl-tRNA synthetase
VDESFRDELLAAGLLIECGVEGLYGRSGAFEGIVAAVETAVTRLGADHNAEVIRFPPLVPRSVFEQTDYLRSFPNLTGSIHTFSGDDRGHAELLAVADSGGDWARLLEPAEVMLCPAVCHPLYPTCTGRLPAGGRTFDLYGWCFRHEPSLDPARMQAFRQREYVYIGEPDRAETHRDRWTERGLTLFGALGLDAEAVVANDPFFGRVGRLLAANQLDEVLKYEIVVPIASGDHPTAVMSANCHRDHFGRPFGIEASDGTPAHSACVGFGVERVSLALLRRHGLRPDSWPAAVRHELWP